VAESAVLADVGFYFYGVVAPGTDLAGLAGLDDVEVEAVEHGGLAAVVSRLPLDRPPGRSVELAAHARVVDTLAAVTTIVPAQFGLVLDHDLAEVVRVLEDGGPGFQELLDRLDGHVQLRLRASYLPEQVLAELVREDPLVAALRESTQQLPPGTPHPDLVRLGESVSRGLNRKRLEDAQTVLDIVLPHTSQHVVRAGGEYDVLDVALLVGRDRVPQVEEALEDLAAVVHERIRLRLVGPVAPYDFVENASWG
jgi:gas vesicle protein GvpL/GvpF